METGYRVLRLGVAGPKQVVTIAVAVVATLATWLLRGAGAESVVVFIVSAVALAALASVVGEATDQLGSRLGPGTTGVLQSALGNLPELFIGIFALRAGLVVVVQSALVGSILANSLLVLGLAFLAGGLKHGVQQFGKRQTRLMAMLLMLSVAALAIPTLATSGAGPAAGHGHELSLVTAVVLLVVFVASVPFSLQGGPGASAEGAWIEARWPLPVALAVLALAGVGAAFVSDWFVGALAPTMAALHLSEAFVGLVIVAIAGNAVENVVGIQMALRNELDFAISLILNSSLQVALALTPVLVLLSRVVGATPLDLTEPFTLVGALGLTALLTALIIDDGESTWLEGLALIGLYVMIAASYWWGA